MWLQDFLPNEQCCKNARILTYGYNTKLIGNDTVEDTILDYARESDEVTVTTTDPMKMHRGDTKMLTQPQEKRRNIIFIGHSFGGIVILQVFVAVRVSHTWKLTQITSF